MYIFRWAVYRMIKTTQHGSYKCYIQHILGYYSSLFIYMTGRIDTEFGIWTDQVEPRGAAAFGGTGVALVHSCLVWNVVGSLLSVGKGQYSIWEMEQSIIGFLHWPVGLF